MNQQPRIDWHYEGKTDYSAGTGATPAERRLSLLAALIVPIFVTAGLWRGEVLWTTAQTVVALLLAADISGGLVANALNSCKRFYHTPPKPHEGLTGRLLKHPVWFGVLHVHPIVVGLWHGQGNWIYAACWYAFYLISLAVVLRTPLYLKRPVSMLLILLAFLVNSYILDPVTGFEWLMPLLFIKIIYGHLVREEPYRN
ncbi:hypothetical protein [Paenibacillus daejeonensis]|uniref:hypothetical protein n=1 Tax=Paenibacillus daejeonensis TaxID=135193 RepID=UPI000373AC99|nr:hypothetical protein [Paenibacillus daejeonensis]